jgi:hypothetical protein
MEQIWPPVRDAFINGEWSAWTIVLAVIGILWLLLAFFKLIFETIKGGMEVVGGKPRESIIVRATPDEVLKYGRTFTRVGMLLLFLGTAITAGLSSKRILDLRSEASSQNEQLAQLGDQLANGKRQLNVALVQIDSARASAKEERERFRLLLSQVESLINKKLAGSPDYSGVDLGQLRKRTTDYLTYIRGLPEFARGVTLDREPLTRYLNDIERLTDLASRNPQLVDVEELRAIKRTVDEIKGRALP